VDSSNELGHIDPEALRAFFEEEFRSKRRAYPRSPLLLLPRTADALLPILATAAAAAGVRMSGKPSAKSSLRQAVPLAHCCHVLVRLLRSSSAPPTERSADIHLGPRYQVELVELLFDADPLSPRYLVSRTWSNGTEASRSMSAEIGDRALRRTEGFNKDAEALERRRKQGAGNASDLILPDSASSGAQDARLQQLFTTADALSTQYQTKVTRTFQTIFVLATVATVLYGLFLVYGTGNRALQESLLAPYLLLLLSAYFVFYSAKRRDLHDRFVEYRALAEGLRVLLYWLACGRDSAGTDGYLASHAVELHWIRVALRSAVWSSSPSHSEPRTRSDPDNSRRALRNWIFREKNYYVGSSARSVRARKRSNLLVRILFICGGCASLLVLLQSRLPVAPLLKRIAMVSFLCPSIAAGVAALVTKLGVLYRAQHHSRMLEIYTEAEHYLGECSAAEALGVAVALGEAALRESEEWTVFRRDRRIDEPASPFRRPG
jgi:hypothetical protein